MEMISITFHISSPSRYWILFFLEMRLDEERESNHRLAASGKSWSNGWFPMSRDSISERLLSSFPHRFQANQRTRRKKRWERHREDLCFIHGSLPSCLGKKNRFLMKEMSVAAGIWSMLQRSVGHQSQLDRYHGLSFESLLGRDSWAVDWRQEGSLSRQDRIFHF